MRVRHLTDFEVQGLLDRRRTATANDVPGATYLKDMDAQEHLDNCPECQAELALYRELYVDLGTMEEFSLPKNFARKVTFSLPPFKAQRTRARLQMAAIWGAALMISLFWLLGRVDWSGLMQKAVLFIAPKLAAIQLWVSAAVGDITLPAFELPDLWGAFVSTLEAAQRAFMSDSATVNLLILAGFALLIIGSLDRLYQAAASRKEEVRF